jgi:hypothetical protein
MPVRAIAPAVGAGKSTVQRDVSHPGTDDHAHQDDDGPVGMERFNYPQIARDGEQVTDTRPPRVAGYAYVKRAPGGGSAIPVEPPAEERASDSLAAAKQAHEAASG